MTTLTKQELAALPRSAYSLTSQVEMAKTPKRFRMNAHSGLPVSHGRWGSLVVDLDGLSIPNENLPILLEHDPERRAGMASRVSVSAKHGVVIEGSFLTSTESGRQAAAEAAEGFPWQASVSVPPTVIEELSEGASATVNGRKVSGPLTIFRRSQLREASFVAIGADPHTSIALLAKRNRAVDVTGLDVEQLTELAKRLPRDADIEAVARDAWMLGSGIAQAFSSRANLQGFLLGVRDGRIVA